MQMTDLINGSFEFVGAFFTWRNALQLHRDRSLQGVYWPTMAFFTVWGFWNIFFYSSLNQPVSLACGVILALGNGAWVWLALGILAEQRRASNAVKGN